LCIYLVLTSSSRRATRASLEIYIKRVMDAGSFAAYERRHVNALAATFGPKLGLLPEIARVVVRFAFHCGYY
jgi:hypothetical protein